MVSSDAPRRGLSPSLMLLPRDAASTVGCEASKGELDANHAGFMVFLDLAIGAVRLELDPTPGCVLLNKVAEQAVPVANRLVVFVQQVDVDSVLESHVD